MRTNHRLSLGVVAAATLAGCGRDELSYRPPLLIASTDLIDFGEVAVGSEGQRTLYLINKGDGVLTLDEPIGTTLGGVFSVVLVQSEVGPLDDVVVRILFTPPTPALFKTTIGFPNDSHNASTYELVLRGAGVSADPCAGVTCATPPPSACLTSTSARHFYPSGTCVGGQCEHEPIDETCEFGCDFATGLCTGDPCRGVQCLDAPNDCFVPQGHCINGACVYTANDGVPCNDLDPCTTNDACRLGRCNGVRTRCESPPPAACLDGNDLRRWEGVGLCDVNGACRYQPIDVPCELGCSGGACRDEACPGGCDDGNPCTDDICGLDLGCQHVASDGGACVAPSGDCPIGRCMGGSCLSQPGVTCVAEYDVDLCANGAVAGVCSASGECVVEDVPPRFTCPGCPGICLQCFVQLCIPLF